MKVLLTLMMAIAVCVSAGWQWYQQTHWQLAIVAKQAQLRVAQQQQTQRQADAQWWAQHQADYQQLLDTGFVGTDARVSWHQQLNKLAVDAGVRHAEFEIVAQSVHQPALHIGNRSLMDTSVQWRGDVVHEGVLVELLSQLVSTKPGIFNVRQCDLNHTSDSALISVGCEFVWQVLQ